jgi:hypothetical protein
VKSLFNVLSRVGVTYETDIGLDDWIYCTTFTQLGTTIQRCRYSTRFTVHRYTRTRVLSLHYSYPSNGFITVSLALQLTHEALFSSPNSSRAIILQLPIPKTRLSSIQSSHPGCLASRNSVLLEYYAWSRLSLSLSLSLILRPTISRSVYLGIKHPSGAYDQIFICI